MAPSPPDRWTLIRDVLTFQLKLLADAIRDVALSPVSLVAALIDLSSDERPRPLFYQLLGLGRRSEDWIDLFGAAERVDPGAARRLPEEPGIDAVVGRVEELLAQQVERGGLTAQAKDVIDRRLDAIVERRRNRDGAIAEPGRDEATDDPV